MRLVGWFALLALAPAAAEEKRSVAECSAQPPSREKAYCLLLTDDARALPELRDVALAKAGDGSEWNIGVEQDFFYAAENAGVIAAKTAHEPLLEYAASSSLASQLFGARGLRHMLSILRMGYALGGDADEKKREALSPVVARACAGKLASTDRRLAIEALRCVGEAHDEQHLPAVLKVVHTSKDAQTRRVAVETLSALHVGTRQQVLAKLAPVLAAPLPKGWGSDDLWLKGDLCSLMAGAVSEKDAWARRAAQAAIDQIGDKHSQVRDSCERLAHRAGARGVAEPVDRRDWYWDGPIEHCRVHAFGEAGSLELCARSLPAGKARRAFELTLRDPSRLEKGDHPLVARAALPAGAGEYAQVELVSQFELSERHYLVYVPLVSGVPDRYDAGRALLYLFDAKTRALSLATESAPCPKGCTGQTLQLRYKPPSPEKTVLLIQTVNGQTRQAALRWDGQAFQTAKEAER